MKNHRERDRARRMAVLKSLIFKAFEKGEEVDEEKLIMSFSIMTGTSIRTIKEYLKLLEFQHHIKRKYGTIFVEKPMIQEKIDDEFDKVINAKPVEEKEDGKTNSP